MPATVTLATTTLSQVAEEGARQVKVASTTGILPGLHLYLDGELMKVVSLGLNSWVNVLRGRGGTQARMHDSGWTVYIGRADQFYTQDPSGSPDEVILVSPHINIQNGSIWFAQGDASPSPEARRWWQKQTVIHATGAFGLRTVEYNPTSST